MAKPTVNEIKRLQESINWSYRQLKPFRENDKEAMKQYVGSNYSDMGAERPVPFSLLELAIGIYEQRLSGGKARALFTTPHDSLKPQTSKLQIGTNHLLEEIAFHTTFSEIVQGAFFSMGIGKIALQQKGKTEYQGFLHDVYQPFFNAVSLCNWVHDMSATRWDKIQYCGDKYTLPLEDARKMFANGDRLKPVKDTRGYGADDDLLEDLTQGSGFNREYYSEITEVWDIWDVLNNRIIVLAAGEGEPCDVTGEYIDSWEWTGSEKGPYRLLRFNNIRDNVMPLPPVGIWMDLHQLANNVMRKLSRQAKRQKTVYGVRPGGESDGTVTMQANDGDMIKLHDPRNVSTLNFPGVESGLLAFLIQIKNMASWLWGNLDALGGLSPQSETLGQDRLLTASASQRLLRMQNVTTDYAHECIWSLAELLYNDPLITLPLTKRIDNYEIQTPWTPYDRENDFMEYNMKLEPYSLQYRSPSERLETIRQTMSQLVFPFSQMMAAQGIFVDFEKLYRIISEYTGLDELNDILIYTNPRQAEQGPIRSLQSPVTNRINTRINRPGATSQGKDEAMASHLLGMGQQGSQMAQITRATG